MILASAPQLLPDNLRSKQMQAMAPERSVSS